MALTVKSAPGQRSRIKRWQRATRHVFDSFACEALVITLVTLYAVVIFIDLSYTAARKKEALPGSGAYRWDQGMKTFDLVLLSIFLVEIVLRLFAYGLEFLKDCINAVDAVVVVASWIIVVVEMSSASLVTGLSWFKLFRIVRLFRFAVIINKLQRSRDAAKMMRKRNMYKKIGAPVEKVLDFFEDLRSRMPDKKDQEYLTWMMEVIASDDLYRVRNFDADTMKKLGEGDDMSKFISQATGISTATNAAGPDGSKAAAAGDAKEDGGSFHHAASGHASTRRPSIPSRSGPSVPLFPLFRADDGLWADTMLCDLQLAGMLHTLHGEDAWSFDVFAFERICKQKVKHNQPHYPATLLVYYLLNYQRIFDAFAIDRRKLLNWCRAVEEAYPPSNQYHTALHAADVVASLTFFLSQPRLERQLGPLDWLAAILAAFVHDVGHPGVNNGFLEATHADLAITHRAGSQKEPLDPHGAEARQPLLPARYNDQSVLENHHAALAFWLARTEPCDWMSGLDSDQYKDFRETMCGMILGTEMRSHFENLNKFKSRVASEGFCTGEAKLERKDVRLLLLIALHAADMANPTKPIALAIEWAARAMDEFFSQGDKEAELGLPISAFMDRKKEPLALNVLNSQIGLINVLTKPFFDEWVGFLGGASSLCVHHLYENIRFWETEGEEAIRTHPSFLTRWNTKRKLLKGGCLGSAGSYSVPGAKPVTLASVAGVRGSDEAAPERSPSPRSPAKAHAVISAASSTVGGSPPMMKV